MRRNIQSKAIFLLFALAFFSCKKESEKHCWVIVDNVGNNLNEVCNKTESELVECVNNKTCGVNLPFAITECNYYASDGEKFCWLVNGSTYLENQTESWINLYKNCFATAAVTEKVACGYCKNWFHREKKTYKPTGTIQYSIITRELFCGDTASTLFQGRQIIRKDDADSLITIQFSNNGADW